MPGRALLARRLHRTVDTVDRALKELTAAGILTIERRSHDRRNLTNRYHLRTHDPDTPAGGTSSGSSRSAAATPTVNPQAQDTAEPAGSRTGAATPRRSSAARVAAALRPNPDVPTETPPPPTTPAATPTPPAAAGPTTGWTEEEDLETGAGRTSRTGDGPLDGCRTPDLAALAATVQGLRRDLGQPSVRWSAPCLATAIDFATKVRGWPAQHARHALLLVAADPQTRSPCAWPKQDPGGTTPNNLASPAPGRSRPNSTAWKPPSPTPTTAPNSNTKPASSSPPQANPSPASASPDAPHASSSTASVAGRGGARGLRAGWALGAYNTPRRRSRRAANTPNGTGSQKVTRRNSNTDVSAWAALS